MRPRSSRPLLVALLALLFAAGGQEFASSWDAHGSYRVARVIDGDTIDVRVGALTERVRILGMNTPETVDPRKPPQCFGKEASDRAKKILSGVRVRLEADPSQDDRDRYGRILRYVFLADGTNFEFAMIRDGYAFEYTFHSAYKYQPQFKAAAAEAKSAKRGLWSSDTCNGKLKSAQ